MLPMEFVWHTGLSQPICVIGVVKFESCKLSVMDLSMLWEKLVEAPAITSIENAVMSSKNFIEKV